jgi:hypothetical protein
MPDLRTLKSPAIDVRLHRLVVRLGWLVLAIAVTYGFVWRARQYGGHYSFSIDELAIARNVTERSVLGLFGRLDFAQIAPVGFLLALKACASLFGPSEWSLRLVPFLCGLAAIPLFWMVARRTLLDSGAAAAATALVALATPLAMWSVVLKQYALDVVAVLAVIAMADWMLERSLRRRDMLVLGGTGCVAAFVSHAVIFAIAASGVVLLADAVYRERRDEFAKRAVVLGAWAAIAASLVLWTTAHAFPPDRLYARKFWSPQFMPWHVHEATQWLWAQFLALFTGDPWPNADLRYARPKIWILLVAIGAVFLLRRRPRHALLLVLPAVLALAASALRQYPFGGRPTLFLVPLALLLVAAGAQAIGSLIGRSAAALAPMLLVPFGLLAMAAYPPTFQPEHLRPGLEYLSSRVQPGDAIWVYYGAAPAFTYYTRRFPIEADVMLGTCDRTDPSATLRQVDAARGRSRVWIVVTHIDPAERRSLFRYLDTIGTRLDTYSRDVRKEAVTASSVSLYRLDDPERLRLASASDAIAYQIDEPSPWSCYGPMSLLPGSEQAAAAALEREAE